MNMTIPLTTEPSEFLAGRFHDIVSRRPAAEPTTLALRRDAGRLVLDLMCHDSRPDEIIARTPSGPDDHVRVYEEDCIQIYLAHPDRPTDVDLLLVNACGARIDSARSKSWRAVASRTPEGWRLTVEIPLDAPLPSLLGLDVFRFHRGQRGQLSALVPSRFTPPEPADFALAQLEPPADPRAGSHHWAGLVRAEQERRGAESDERARSALTEAVTACPLDISRKTFDTLLARRDALGVSFVKTGRLFWNECHLLHGLLDMFDATGDRTYFAAAAARIPEILAERADRRGRRCPARDAVLPVWLADGPTAVALPLATGVVLGSIARLLRIAHREGMRELLPFDEWLGACRQSIEAHEPEWRELPDGSGLYMEPYDCGPRDIYACGGSRPSPLNRHNFMGLALLDLAAVTDDASWLHKADALARFTCRNLELTRHDSYQWEYEELPYAGPGEDTSHAAVQVIYAWRCFREGRLFAVQDMARLANTLDIDVLGDRDMPADTVRGLGASLGPAPAAWACLLGLRPSLYPRLCNLVVHYLHQLGTPEREGYALRLVAGLVKAKRRIEAGGERLPCGLL